MTVNLKLITWRLIFIQGWIMNMWLISFIIAVQYRCMFMSGFL